MEDRMMKMNIKLKVQKTTGGVIHYGHEGPHGTLYSACGGQVYASGLVQNIAPYRELDTDIKVTCKRCTKKAEKLGLPVAKEEEEAPPQETPTEAPAIYDHAAAVAKLRANREAEEEERAAARRARNRTNYAPAPAAQEDATITREPEDRTLTEVEEMEDRYQDLVHVGRGLRLLSDQFARMLVDMKYEEGLADNHPRVERIKRKMDRNLRLEGANLAEREKLSVEIREARGQGRCLQRGAERGGSPLQCLQVRGHSGDCKNSRGESFTNWLDPEAKMSGFTSKTPVMVLDAETSPKVKDFHRQVKDAIGLKW